MGSLKLYRYAKIIIFGSLIFLAILFIAAAYAGPEQNRILLSAPVLYILFSFLIMTMTFAYPKNGKGLIQKIEFREEYNDTLYDIYDRIKKGRERPEKFYKTYYRPIYGTQNNGGESTWTSVFGMGVLVLIAFAAVIQKTIGFTLVMTVMYFFAFVFVWIICASAKKYYDKMLAAEIARGAEIKAKMEDFFGDKAAVYDFTKWDL